jgi:hypothetical protein
MSGIRYTPPAGIGVIPDLQQVLDAGNSATDQNITLIKSGLAQIQLETDALNGGSITVSEQGPFVPYYIKIKSRNIEVQPSLFPTIGTINFETLTAARGWRFRDRSGDVAFTDELPQDTSSTSITVFTDYTIFGTGGSTASVRKVGKLVTVNIGFTRIASVEFRICTLPTGYRPALRWKGIIANSLGIALDIEVATNGTISIDSGLPAGIIGTTWLCLISFYTT